MSMLSSAVKNFYQLFLPLCTSRTKFHSFRVLEERVIRERNFGSFSAGSFPRNSVFIKFSEDKRRICCVLLWLNDACDDSCLTGSHVNLLTNRIILSPRY